MIFKIFNSLFLDVLRVQQQTVSPELLEAQNLELAVPGTYRAG